MIALIPGLQETLAFLRPQSKPPQENFAQVLKASTEAAPTTPTPPPEYVVQAGDNLCDIAKKLGYSDPWAIARANNLKNPDLLHVGQVLRLPPKNQTGPKAAPPAAPPSKAVLARKSATSRAPAAPVRLAGGRGKLVLASWYGPEHHGKIMANGQPFNMYADTVAHPSLPLGTNLRLTNPANGRTAEVQVTDRGPYIPGRSLDLSFGVARKLGMVEKGVGRVRMEPS